MKVTQRMLKKVRGAQRVFDLFEAFVREWRETLGLDGWHIVVQTTEDNEIASCVADPAYKRALISVNTKRVLAERFYTPLHLESVAVHELVHSLVWLPFNELANPKIPLKVMTHFEERHTEKLARSHLRAKYNNHPVISTLWTDYVVIK